jgi:hypothetical protein
MKAYFDATDEKGRAEAIDRLCASGAQARDVERLLRAGLPYAKDVLTGWQALEIEGFDGKRRPYHVYAPPEYDPGKKYPLVVFLHGAVSRANGPSTQEMESLRKDFEKEVPGFLIILPTGAKGAAWWDKVGTSNILAQVVHVKRRYNVDENRVFLWGFSDGGSGAYWMAMSRPTAWAGFISYSANVAAADVAIVLLDCLDYLRERQLMLDEPLGINTYLVLFLVSAPAINLRHPFHGPEVRPDDPVMNSAQLHELLDLLHFWQR